jgi:hypothetical protein
MEWPVGNEFQPATRLLFQKHLHSLRDVCVLLPLQECLREVGGSFKRVEAPDATSGGLPHLHSYTF